jgi:hypothetical protein
MIPKTILPDSPLLHLHTFTVISGKIHFHSLNEFGGIISFGIEKKMKMIGKNCPGY